MKALRQSWQAKGIRTDPCTLLNSTKRSCVSAYPLRQRRAGSQERLWHSLTWNPESASVFQKRGSEKRGTSSSQTAGDGLSRTPMHRVHTTLSRSIDLLVPL